MELTQMQFDAFKEIGNVGIGNAATALSNLMNKSVGLNLPLSKMIPLADLAAECGGAENEVEALYLKVTGDLEGETFFFFKTDQALKLVNLMGLPSTQMNEDAISAFKEMSNIFSGAYLNSISKMLDVTLLPQVPQHGADMLGSLLDSVLAQYGTVADNLLIIRTDIVVEGEAIDGVYLFFFDKPSLEKLVGKLKDLYGV